MEYLNWFTFLIIVFITGLWFLINYILIKKNIRTMWIGVTLIILFLHLLLLVEFGLLLLRMYISPFPAIIVLGIITLVFVLFNSFLILYLIFNGIKMIKKEGVSFANVLPLILATLLIGNQIIIMLNISLPFLEDLRFLLSMIVAYFNVMLLIFIVSCVSFFYRKPKGQIDYIIVHGAGIVDNKITPLLSGRVDVGIELLKQQDDSCKIIMSGGVGKGKKYSEAEVMKAYAIEKGITAQQILLEDRSHTTEENLSFSEELIENDTQKVSPISVIVTSDYHIFRVLLIARKMNVNIHYNRGSKTARYYLPSAILREFVAVLKLHWKSSFFIFMLFFGGFLVIVILDIITSYM